MIKKPAKKKIIVAMSGGVDSSVAAQLLKNQGHEVVGMFLHFWKEEVPGLTEAENKCCSVEALMDARRVCQQIGIPLYTLNFTEIFKDQVVDNFVAAYGAGQTPNPCVLCNKFVKLGNLITKAHDLGFDYVASGHYAKLKIKNYKLKETEVKLFKGSDEKKDQSYFLYYLSQEQLQHLIFPIGDYKKSKVRELAKKFKLPTASKRESQEICFIPEKDHNAFLYRHLKLKPGPIMTFDGQKLGEHKGLPLYTIGQRKGIEIGGTGPFYAAEFDYQKNILYVVNDLNDPRLLKKEAVINKVNWITGEPKLPLKASAVIRYGHPAVECTVVKNGTDKYQVTFATAQRAVTPGQSLVLYDGEEVIGGGIIE